MAHINISEGDFETVAGAALDAKYHGDLGQARKLDKIARKINAALSRSKVPFGGKAGPATETFTWRDVPSTIGDEG